MIQDGERAGGTPSTGSATEGEKQRGSWVQESVTTAQANAGSAKPLRGP